MTNPYIKNLLVLYDAHNYDKKILLGFEHNNCNLIFQTLRLGVLHYESLVIWSIVFVFKRLRHKSSRIVISGYMVTYNYISSHVSSHIVIRIFSYIYSYTLAHIVIFSHVCAYTTQYIHYMILYKWKSECIHIIYPWIAADNCAWPLIIYIRLRIRFYINRVLLILYAWKIKNHKRFHAWFRMISHNQLLSYMILHTSPDYFHYRIQLYMQYEFHKCIKVHFNNRKRCVNIYARIE